MPESTLLDRDVILLPEWEEDEYPEDDDPPCSDPNCEECYPEPPVFANTPRRVATTRFDESLRVEANRLREQMREQRTYSPYTNTTTTIWDHPIVALPIREEAPVPEQTAVAVNINHLQPSSTGYGQHLRASFQFFRRHAQNRYSASTLMRLANAAGEFDDRTRQGTEDSPRTSSLLPVLTVASRPLSYDEDTEIKNGGTVGMMVTWPDGKALFAVVSGSRRQGIGRRIFAHNSRYANVNPYFWVNTSNVPAQQFLLAMGLTPTGLNGNGAVRYGYSGGEE